MDTKNLSLLFKTSFLAATMSMVVGCSDNPIPTATTTTAEAESAVDKTIDNAASNGTVVTVADGYGTSCTVTSGDLEAVEVEDTRGKYFFLTHPVAPILAINCIDFHTKVALPRLSAPTPPAKTSFGILDDYNITPISSIRYSYIESGLEPLVADLRTREFLNLGENVDLGADPVKSSQDGGTDNDAFVKAALKVTAISIALEKTGQTDPIKAIAQATKTKTATNTTIDDAIGDDAVINQVVTNTAQRASAKTITASIKTAIDTNTNGQTGSNVIDNIAKIIKTVADQKTSIATLSNPTTLATTSAARTDLDDAGKVTKTITADSTEFKNVVTKIKVEVKKNPDVKIVPDSIKETVKAQVEELKAVSGAVAGN